MLLNLKKLSIQVPAGEPRTVRVDVSGPKTVTGADVPETDDGDESRGEHERNTTHAGSGIVPPKPRRHPLA